MLLQNEKVHQTVTLPNGDYSLAFQYKKKISTASCTVRYNGREFILEEAGLIQTTGEITTKSLTIEFDCDTNDGYEIFGLMCNHGTDIYLPWCQNQNEMRTDYVTIGKGISVDSDVSDTRTTLNADGLRGYNKSSNEIVFRQTSTGSYSKRVDADEGAIAGLSLKKVGRQTWGVGI